MARLLDIPSPKRQAFVGNLLQIPSGKLSEYLLETSAGFDGIFEVDFAGYRVPFVHSAELVAELSDETRFRKIIRPPLSLLRQVVGDGLFTAHSDSVPWGKAHRVLMPAFGPRAMRSYFDAMLDIGQQLVASWERRLGEDILVADDMTRLTLDTISLAGFGYRFNSFAANELHPFLAAMVRVLSGTMARLTRLPIVDRLLGAPRHMTDDIALMNALVDEVIRQRRAHPAPANDLLNLMLTAVDPQTGERLDDTNIRHQVITFLVAGHETTSGLLTFALYLLLRHPHVLAQAYAEVDRVLPGDAVPEYADLARLEVIERVLKETLRLWPTAPGYTVAPYEDTVLGGRYLIRKDRSVSITIPALHRDPKVWPEPHAFDIDRFLPEAEAARHPHAYKPFGNGQRACIGRQFALTEAKLALALILQRFALSDPHGYRLQIKQTLTLKPDQFYIRVRRRQPHERIVSAAVAVPAQPQAAAAAEAVEVRGDGTAFTVLYGSTLGSSRDVAEEIAARAQRSGFASAIAPLDERIETLPDSGVLVVVTSTYNGRAPDSARRTEELLDSGALGAMKRPGLRYAVLGCGNSQWPNYQAFPTRIDRLLADAGATAVVARGEADGNGDFDAAAERWQDGFWSALGAGQEAVAPARPAVTVRLAAAAELRSAVLPAAAQLLTVVANEELVRDPSGLWDFAQEAPRTPTRHLRLALPDGASYRTGDHLAVYPRNPPALVDTVLARLGLDPETVVVLDAETGRIRHLPLGRPLTMRRLLSDFVELQDPVNQRDLTGLLRHTRCPHTRVQLEAAAGGETGERPTLVELLLRYPAIELPLEALLELCPPLRPRLYSISSSALATPHELSLTVGTMRGPAPSGRGVASAYIEALRPGDALLGVIRPASPPFTPADDPGTPMILIGPGTGLAPFRGFLQERAVQREQGASVATSLLFFGCRHPEHDWFYREEMQHWQDQGIAELHLAFSCLTGHPCRYVQDALWAARGAVWRALETGAVVYVCGDGRLMAPAVRDCLLRIHQDRAGSSHAEASAWLETLLREGRYKQDVFGPA